MKNSRSRILALLLLAAVTASAAPNEKSIPDALKPWEGWATWGDEHRLCPTPYSDAKKHVCFWPSRMGLQADKAGGKFDLVVTIFHETWIPLPGNSDVWPMDVKADGAPVPVLEKNGVPSIKLSAGTIRLEGAFRWSDVPQRIPIPREIGILVLVIDGQPVEAPAWDAQGFLWLKRDASTEQADKNFLSVKLHAAIDDGIPLWLHTEIELTVSGKSREEEIGVVLPEGWKLASVDSAIPVAIDDAGKMKAQVRAGNWTVSANAFRFDNPKEVRYAEGAKPAIAEEFIAFRAQPDFRTVEIVGASAIDVSQTNFPEQWRELPVYRWETATPFQLQEKMRGMGDQKPAGLKITRELWLDENGGGLTFRDQIKGAMQQIWRLDAAAGQDLGSVRSDGQGQLITRNPQTSAPGVEIRTRNLNLEAAGRMTRTDALSATGWRSDADALAVTLNLPPGWRLFALFGADWVRGDWLTAWTLLDLFVLLIFSLAVFRLWGFFAGILAFLAFGLSFHEPGAPRYLWLILLVPLALQRVVPEGWARRALGLGKWIAVGAFVLVLVPFIAAQVQQALYPQLEIANAYADSRSAPQEVTAPQDEALGMTDAAPAMDSAGSSRINAKLSRIIIPKIEFRDATIREAVDFLRKKSVDLDTAEEDPSRKGVNIVLKLSDGASANGFSPPPDATGGIGPGEPRITVSLTNIPLIEALKYVTGLANLKFKVDPYAVTIVPQGVDTTVFQTKEFVVRPGFINRVAGRSDADATKGGASIAGRMDAKEFLMASGVSFPAGSSATYLPGSNRIVMRNTQENLDLMSMTIDAADAPGTPGLEVNAVAAPAALADGTRGFRQAHNPSENLGYDAKARIQTGPGVPDWQWRAVSFGWSGPVSASQQVKPILISLTLERLLTALRIALLLLLAGVLLRVRKFGAPIFRQSGKTAAAVLFVVTLNASAQSPIPDSSTLEKLRERLLETSDAFPRAADIPSVTLTLGNERKITIDAEIHTAMRTAVPLPGRLPAWSPLNVLVDDKPEVALRRDDGFLWLVLDPGVHRVRVEGSLANATEWEWTYLLKPRQVKIDAPDWNTTGLRGDGVPEAQVFFVLKQKAEAVAAAYERQDLRTIVAIDRSIELGLIWQVHTTVTRLSPVGKAAALRVPLLPGENVLSSDAIVKDGFIEVRLGAQAQTVSWESGLGIVPSIAIATRADDAWVERWQLVASPVWNVSLSGLAPVFQADAQKPDTGNITIIAGGGDLIPTWQPWPGEKVALAISRPEAIAGATMTVSQGSHTIALGKRQRVSKLDLSLRCSLGEDFLVELPADAEISALAHNGKAIPVRKDGGKLIIPVRPGEQTVNLDWKTNIELGSRAEAGGVRLPVESANIQTIITVPGDRWVLWAHGPQRGPAVRFWGILLCSLLAAVALGRIGKSPLHTLEWMLLVIGLTQVPLIAALVVVGWLFVIAWRGDASFQLLGNKRYNVVQVALIALTVAALGILFTAVGEGLLGNPEMFITGNGSTPSTLRWFQARCENLLPSPGVVSISIWWYRFFMLAWALWIAASLIRWLRTGWTSFSSGGFFHRKPKAQPAPPPLPVQVPNEH